MNYIAKNILTFIFALSLTFSGCGPKNSDSNNRPESPAPIQKKSNDNNQDPTNTGNPHKEKEDFKFKELGLIREFGGTDNAALFGVLPNAGKLQITKVVGPAFIKTYLVGELNQNTINKLFLKTTKPLNQEERNNLVSEFNGATVIYTEGYSGNLCNNDEMKYEIISTGQIDETNIEITFQFEALPNPSGNCSFHLFGILTKYIQ